MQKEEITRIMENSKRNQKKAAKLIQKVTFLLRPRAHSFVDASISWAHAAYRTTQG